jgi:hypothetical protein
MPCKPVRLLLPLAALLAALPAAAQSGLTLPPSGDNQFASVTQGIGPIRLTVEYSSPDVHGPTGEDRRGKIWGDLVPFGMADLGFGTCGDQCPWRGGANENTVFTTTHDVEVQGKPLPAGTYGLHFIPGKEEWTVVFSKNHTSWGSYFYDVKEDALRVQTKPEKGEYREWLTYEFTDRQPDKATLALKWEELQVPVTIGAKDINEVYFAAIRNQLRSSPGFDPRNYEAAAQFALQVKGNLVEGLTWAQNAAQPPTGLETFSSLSTLALLQEANGKGDDSRKTMDRALNLPTAAPTDLHQYGRRLQQQKKNEEAMKVFELNARRFPDTWPVHVGLARGHAGLGRQKEALAEARLALKQAPDDASRRNLEALIKQIEEGKYSG